MTHLQYTSTLYRTLSVPTILVASQTYNPLSANEANLINSRLLLAIKILFRFHEICKSSALFSTVKRQIMYTEIRLVVDCHRPNNLYRQIHPLQPLFRKHYLSTHSLGFHLLSSHQFAIYSVVIKH